MLYFSYSKIMNSCLSQVQVLITRNHLFRSSHPLAVSMVTPFPSPCLLCRSHGLLEREREEGREGGREGGRERERKRYVYKWLYFHLQNNNYTSHGNYGFHTGLSCWSPVINILRDPRWGRNQVTTTIVFLKSGLTRSQIPDLTGF